MVKHMYLYRAYPGYYNLRVTVFVITVFQTHDHSQCVRPPLPPYSVSPQNATFNLKGSFVSKIVPVFFRCKYWPGLLTKSKPECDLHLLAVGNSH